MPTWTLRLLLTASVVTLAACNQKAADDDDDHGDDTAASDTAASDTDAGADTDADTDTDTGAGGGPCEVWLDDNLDGVTPSNLTLNGTAFHNTSAPDGNIEMVSSGQYESATVFLNQRIPSARIHVTWTANLGTGDGDGQILVFADASDPSYFNSNQGAYGVVDFGGYAVLFDTYPNQSDPASSDFLAVVANTGWPMEILDFTTDVPDMNDGADHRVEVYILGGRIIVSVDGVERLDHTIDGYALEDVQIGWGAHNGIYTSTMSIDDPFIACDAP